MSREHLKTYVRILRPEAKRPCYMTEHAACADLFLPADVTIEPHETAKVPLGIAFDMPRGTHLKFYPRSSLLVNMGLISPVSVIDCDYKGEVHAVLHNVSDRPVELLKGERVLQAEIIDETYYGCDWDHVNQERDQNGFGGTGR